MERKWHCIFSSSGIQTKINEIRDWDLYGPLIITLLLTLLLSLKQNFRDTEKTFSLVFFFVVFGSLLVAINAKLTGVKFSIFFYACVIGYSLSPFLVAQVASILFEGVLTKVGTSIVTGICYIMVMKSVNSLFVSTLPEKKHFLVMYPVSLFFLFFAFIIVLQ